MLHRPASGPDGDAPGVATRAAGPPRRRAPSWWPRIYYGWYMATAGAASNFLVLGITVFGFGVFIPPLRDELGWTIAQISIAFSLRSFENGLLAPFTGFMVDRLGARRMAFTGLFALVIGLLLFSQSRTIWAFYGASLVMAFGQSLGSFTPFSAALMNWFTRQRGRAMGLVSTGNGAGGLAAPVLATMIVLIGWRETAIASALVIGLVGFPLAMTLRDRPEPYGYAPDGVPLDQAARQRATRGGPPAAASGMSVGEVLRTPAFYLLAMSSGLGGAILGTWIVHQIPHLEAEGFSLQAAASIAGFYALFQIGMRYVLGWVGDTVGRRPMFVASFVLIGIGLLVFSRLNPGQVWLIPIYYLTFATGHATFVVMSQTVVADYFGTRRFATIRGLAQSTAMPLGIVGPVFAGWMFDRTGSYEIALTVLSSCAIFAAICILLIRRPQWGELATTPALSPAPAASVIPAAPVTAAAPAAAMRPQSTHRGMGDDEPDGAAPGRAYEPPASVQR
ncbi:MAG: MFS transporter [Chloroflexi bacterium]|nr:MFS transporter [Chloroflexota bacterium]